MLKWVFYYFWRENSNTTGCVGKQNSKNWIFLYGVVRTKKGAQIGFFLLSWSVMQNTRQQRIHDLNFTLRHHKNYVIKGQFVCLYYADFENYSKHINIVTSFLSIIMQHTVCENQQKKSHSILWAKRATVTKIAKNSQN